MKFFRNILGNYPSNQLASLALARQKRNHGKSFLAEKCDVMRGHKSPLFDLVRVLVRFDHVASFIVNANHGIMHSEYQISGHVANITKVAAT